MSDGPLIVDAIEASIRRLRGQNVMLDADLASLARKLDLLKGKYDAQFKAVFQAIRELMAPPKVTPRRIGFRGE